MDHWEGVSFKSQEKRKEKKRNRDFGVDNIPLLLMILIENGEDRFYMRVEMGSLFRESLPYSVQKACIISFIHPR
jgi:hypothetical protein